MSLIMKNLTQTIIWTSVLVMTLIGCTANDDPETLKTEGRKWASFYQAGDLEGLMSLYTENAMVALHDQPALHGKDSIRAYFAPRIGKSEVKFELEYEVQESNQKLAYIISKYWLIAKQGDSGKIYRDAGRSLLVYKRENNAWKIAADIDQSTPDVKWPSPSGLF